MRSLKPPATNIFLTRRTRKPQKTVHEALSECQAAYAVYRPKPDDVFNLFEIIFLHHERPLSPRNANTNLHDIFQQLQDYPDDEFDNRLVDLFLEQFSKVRHEVISRDSEFIRVSKESLRKAGLTISTPVPSLSSKVSRSHTMERQLRLTWLSLDAYTGRKKLQKLIWKHASAVFLLILRDLDSSFFPKVRGDKSLMGIVTKRIISKVGTSRVEERDTAAHLAIDGGTGAGIGNISGGAERRKVLREAYDDLYGVSGLHFIAFKIECIDRHRWRVYEGIDVCDSELDESDDFSEAVRWHRGTGSLNTVSESNYTTVTQQDSAGSEASANNAAFHGHRAQDDSGYVDVTFKHQTAPFVDIDIRPFLSEFANKQCKLAAYYRKTDPSSRRKRTQAVSILRSALRKCCFESTIRALYDLSGCYLHEIGVQADFNIAQLLRYCAGGMRRSYATRVWWLRRLAMEIGFRRDEAPERSIGCMALLSRWRLVVIKEETNKHFAHFGRDDIEKNVPLIPKETENTRPDVIGGSEQQHVAGILAVSNTDPGGPVGDPQTTSPLYREGPATKGVVVASAIMPTVDEVRTSFEGHEFLEANPTTAERAATESLESIQHHTSLDEAADSTRQETRSSSVHPGSSEALRPQHVPLDPFPPNQGVYVIPASSGEMTIHPMEIYRTAPMTALHPLSMLLTPTVQTYCLWVPPEQVGAVIDGRGTVIRYIQERSGATMQMHNDAVQNGCQLFTIFGTLARCEAAAQLLNQVLERFWRSADVGSSVSSESTLGDHTSSAIEWYKIVYVPQRCVSLVIGRNGETIRSLQDKTGAAIKVMRDEEAPPGSSSISISGTERAISHAHQLVSEIVVEARVRSSLPPMVPRPREEVPIVERLVIPNDKVELFIGKNGAKISDIQRRSGVKIQLAKEDNGFQKNGCRLVTITGTRSNVDKAIARIIYAPGCARPTTTPLQGLGKPVRFFSPTNICEAEFQSQPAPVPQTFDADDNFDQLLATMEGDRYMGRDNYPKMQSVGSLPCVAMPLPLIQPLQPPPMGHYHYPKMQSVGSLPCVAMPLPLIQPLQPPPTRAQTSQTRNVSSSVESHTTTQIAAKGQAETGTGSDQDIRGHASENETAQQARASKGAQSGN